MAGVHNFVIQKGEDWSKIVSVALEGSHVDQTGYTVEMDLRANPASSTELLTLTTGNGRASINGSGDIVLSLTKTETAALTFDRAYYDLKFTTPGGVSSYWLSGMVIIVQTVTR